MNGIKKLLPSLYIEIGFLLTGKKGIPGKSSVVP
jgi:hypothetical protein